MELEKVKLNKDFFEKYEKVIESADYYRLKDKWLTLFCGFYSKNDNCTYVLRYRHDLDVYKGIGKLHVKKIICKIENRDSDSDVINIGQAVSGFESGKIVGT